MTVAFSSRNTFILSAMWILDTRSRGASCKTPQFPCIVFQMCPPTPPPPPKKKQKKLAIIFLLPVNTLSVHLELLGCCSSDTTEQVNEIFWHTFYHLFELVRPMEGNFYSALVHHLQQGSSHSEEIAGDNCCVEPE